MNLLAGVKLEAGNVSEAAKAGQTGSKTQPRKRVKSEIKAQPLSWSQPSQASQAGIGESSSSSSSAQPNIDVKMEANIDGEMEATALSQTQILK